MDQEDLEAMWEVPEVSEEWLKAGEVKGHKIHLSRDPEGQPYLTQTEMRAVADIVIGRHFHSQIDPSMICAIAELESDRQLLVMQSNNKSKEPTLGLMQLSPKTVEQLMRKSAHDDYPPPSNRRESSSEKPTDASDDTYWDSRASPEDMADMWNHPEVRKEWNKSKERQGKVRFNQDENNEPYLSRVELKAVADIVLCKHLLTKKVKSTVLCAISEVVSKRLVNGVGERPGIMGIDYATAYWVYLELGYRAYKLESIDDLKCPFVSMYFGAAYVAWLSEYEGRERAPDFVAQAYFVGPKKVNPQDTSTLWLKFVEALSKYEETKRNRDSCSIM
ncbi:unnamed protein product [Lupinus luteus]|uniref:Transglycosylase SLT domain-containing protein n=1 Tax=Lupinus luteus TaxID=3873 RepID=A0AAV1XXU3_LUPLU